jgi:flagellar hook-basal body complex protein FliE
MDAVIQCECGKVCKSNTGLAIHKRACKREAVPAVVPQPVIDQPNEDPEIVEINEAPINNSNVNTDTGTGIFNLPLRVRQQYAQQQQQAQQAQQQTVHTINTINGIPIESMNGNPGMQSMVEIITKLIPALSSAGGGNYILQAQVSAQTARIKFLEDQCIEKDKIIKYLEDRSDFLEEKLLEIYEKAGVIRRIDADAKEIKINQFDEPNTSYLNLATYTEIFRHQKVRTPIELINFFWTNDDHPENFSIYVTDYKKDEVRIFKNNEWITVTKEEAYAPIRELVYALVIKMIPELPVENDNIYTPFQDCVYMKIKANYVDPELIPLEYDFFHRWFTREAKRIIKVLKSNEIIAKRAIEAANAAKTAAEKPPVTEVAKTTTAQ